MSDEGHSLPDPTALANTFATRLGGTRSAEDVERWLGEPHVALQLLQWKLMANIDKRTRNGDTTLGSHREVLQGEQNVQGDK